MTRHPTPAVDPWLDEMRASLFGQPARYKADELPDEAKVRKGRPPITLGSMAVPR